MPLVTVLMSVYNDARWLDTSIPSILGQTFTDFEFIIVDDGSIDKSLEIIKRYASKDQRIKYIKLKKNLGTARALNEGLKIARGKYVAKQDADDISMPERLEQEVRFLENHPDIAVVGSFVKIIGPDNEDLGVLCFPEEDQQIRKFMIKRCPFIHSSVLIKREALSVIGGYNPSLRRVQDYDLWFKILSRFKGANLPLLLVAYRLYPEGYKRKKFRYRLMEAKVRFRGVRTIKAPLNAYIYAFKPLIVGLLPTSLLLRWHKRQFSINKSKARL